MQRGNKAEAVRVWELNAKRYPNQWPVNVGLMRAASASGKYKDALKYAKLALAQAPDEGNKKNIEGQIKKLEEGKDVN
jgi:putative alpha-1,2-mannosidase